MQTADGVNTAGLRYNSLTGTGVEVFVEEEKSFDNETDHSTEIVGYIALWGASKTYDDLYVEAPPVMPCDTMSGYEKQCDVTTWHPSTFY